MRHLKIDIGNEISSVRLYNDDNLLIRQYHITADGSGFTDSDMGQVVNDRGIDVCLQVALLDMEARIIDCMRQLRT